MTIYRDDYMLKKQIATQNEIRQCAFRDGFYEAINRGLTILIFILILGFIVSTISQQNETRKVNYEHHHRT